MPLTARSDVYAALDSERDHQDRKWGKVGEPEPDGHNHSIAEWILVLEEQVARAKANWYMGHHGVALEEIRQVGAVAVACMEQHGAPKR